MGIAKRKMMDGEHMGQLRLHGNTVAQAKYNQMLSWFADKSKCKPTSNRPNTIDLIMDLCKLPDIIKYV
jgi:hypothetical protein